MDEPFYIAGDLKASDWCERKRMLVEAGGAELWMKTFEEFFCQRLSLRYLEPIKTLQREGTFQGEGFSIVTIQCALIEFLAATRAGKKYKFLKRGERQRVHEYSNSNGLFTEFLTTYEPFNKWFDSRDNAQEFYTNVRCALLHEARTKSGWRIWASGNIAVDPTKKIVSRDALQVGIIQYIEAYGRLLLTDKEIQNAFIRKFDDLAIE